ncbi:unnamed protein product, partial [Menidia menidia]
VWPLEGGHVTAKQGTEETSLPPTKKTTDNNLKHLIFSLLNADFAEFIGLVAALHQRDAMPVICAATGCNNKFVKGSEIRFYRFPLSKPQLASKWVQSLGMKNFIPTANTCLCSEHFRTDCFRDYNGKQFLREDAVPTIFSQGPDSSK